MYRDGIILKGKIANLEAAVRGSFKSKDKPSLEEIAEGDKIAAVVLPDRWGSGLNEWELTIVTQKKNTKQQRDS